MYTDEYLDSFNNVTNFLSVEDYRRTTISQKLCQKISFSLENRNIANGGIHFSYIFQLHPLIFNIRRKASKFKEI